MTDKGLISNIYKQLMQLNIRNANNPIKKKKKMVEDLNRYLYVRDRLKQIKWQQQQKKLWTYFNLKLYVVFSIC